MASEKKYTVNAAGFKKAMSEKRFDDAVSILNELKKEESDKTAQKKARKELDEIIGKANDIGGDPHFTAAIRNKRPKLLKTLFDSCTLEQKKNKLGKTTANRHDLLEYAAQQNSLESIKVFINEYEKSEDFTLSEVLANKDYSVAYQSSSSGNLDTFEFMKMKYHKSSLNMNIFFKNAFGAILFCNNPFYVSYAVYDQSLKENLDITDEVTSPLKETFAIKFDLTKAGDKKAEYTKKKIRLLMSYAADIEEQGVASGKNQNLLLDILNSLGNNPNHLQVEEWNFIKNKIFGDKTDGQIIEEIKVKKAELFASLDTRYKFRNEIAFIRSMIEDPVKQEMFSNIISIGNEKLQKPDSKNENSNSKTLNDTEEQAAALNIMQRIIENKDGKLAEKKTNRLIAIRNLYGGLLTAEEMNKAFVDRFRFTYEHKTTDKDGKEIVEKIYRVGKKQNDYEEEINEDDKTYKIVKKKAKSEKEEIFEEADFKRFPIVQSKLNSPESVIEFCKKRIAERGKKKSFVEDLNKKDLNNNNNNDISLC